MTLHYTLFRDSTHILRGGQTSTAPGPDRHALFDFVDVENSRSSGVLTHLETLLFGSHDKHRDHW
eukprot:7110858-Alexandrium_andersonii.AAC.1